MSRTKRSRRTSKFQKNNRNRIGNDQRFIDLIEFVLPEGELFSKDVFHGNINGFPNSWPRKRWFGHGRILRMSWMHSTRRRKSANRLV